MSVPRTPPPSDRVSATGIRPAATSADFDLIADLAQRIWVEHYVPIVGRAQVDYMLANFQSVAAIAAQTAEGVEYFVLCEGVEAGPAARAVGYCAIESEPEALMLSKLYVLKEARGQGWARAALRYLEALARRRGATQIWLKVNKHNPALRAYLALGFENRGSLITDIGGGFVMDDFRLTKPVPP